MSAKPTTTTYLCPWWLIWFLDNPLRRLIHHPETILAPHVQPGDTALDIGCGPGYFTLPLARLVGLHGSVIAADLQPQMLDIVRRRAGRAGLLPRIHLHHCAAGQLGVDTPVDFALAFAMLHETQHTADLLAEVAAVLKPAGRLLVAEPRAHVSAQLFAETLMLARAVSLEPCLEPRIAMCRAVLLRPSLH